MFLIVDWNKIPTFAKIKPKEGVGDRGKVNHRFNNNTSLPLHTPNKNTNVVKESHPKFSPKNKKGL